MKRVTTPQAAADAIVARMMREAIRAHIQQYGVAATLHLLADLVEEPVDVPVPVRGTRKSRRGMPAAAGTETV